MRGIDVPKHKWRESDLHHPIDYKPPSRPVVGRIIDSGQMLATVPDTPSEQVASVRQHIVERMIDVEDGKLLAEALGIRWRDIGDWPDDEVVIDE
jgi:hypothetical protein